MVWCFPCKVVIVMNARKVFKSMSLRQVNWHEWLWWCKENFIPWGPISLNLHCWKLQTWKMYSKFKYLTPISSHVPVKVNVVVKTYLCIIHIYSLHLHSFFQYFRSYWFSTMSFVEIFAEWQSFCWTIEWWSAWKPEGHQMVST